MRSLSHPILLFVQFIAQFGTWLHRADLAVTNCSSPVLLTAPICIDTHLCHQPCFNGDITSIVSRSTTLWATTATLEDIKTTEFLCSFSGHGGAATMRSLSHPILLFVQFIAQFGTWLQRADLAVTNCSSPVLLTAPICIDTHLCHQPCFNGDITSIVSRSTTLWATTATLEDIKTTEFLCSFSGHGGAATMRSLSHPILLFVQSLQTSTLPSDWKAGKVVPVHKSGDVHSPNNYRPISLTSIPVKILEHVIYSHLIDFLESNSFFSIYQHGFRKAVSCETQLLCFTNDLFINADLELDTDCIYLDFAKAFDTVSHELLIFKLNQLNIDPNVLAWIKEFLSNRSQYVTLTIFVPLIPL
ncbi:uncharacterized protein LOC125756402 [Rhipicephalus sanguineus]|uniref:uncharacterized protein LOC125756402 n=1 Tax=Rhipicephalus sanguineus TaxID=34632 RepID=UPI0020C2349C|nr:uncharacterized protein LOC125756402 [Rhipicephalus sanguineus]